MQNNYNTLTDKSMKKLRLSEHKIAISGNFFVEDELKTKGALKLYEYLGGPILMHLKPSEMNNAVLVASITITTRRHRMESRLEKIFHEYGYDSLVGPMLDQVLHFADFYGYSFILLDLTKKTNRKTSIKV